MSTVKSQISAGFSQNTWLKQEHQMNKTLDFFVQRLHEQTSSTTTTTTTKTTPSQEIALNQWLGLWTFDTLAQLAFSDSRGFLAHGRDVDGVFAGSAARFLHWKHWTLLPTLEHGLYKSWLAQRVLSAWGRPPPGSALVQLATARIEERKRDLLLLSSSSSQPSNEKAPKEKGEEAGEDIDSRSRGDFDLVGRFLAASARNPRAIDGEKDVLALTLSTIHAGADTTSSASAHALANALAQPGTWTLLEEEILGAGLTCPPAFKEVASLPVLDAVVRESL